MPEKLTTKSLIQIKLKTTQEHLFGFQTQGKMHENTEARIASKVWLELPFEFHNVKLLYYDILPDEFVAVIEVDHIAGNPSEISYKKNGKWKRQAESKLKKERCKILATSLISRFKSRTCLLLNQLHSKPGRLIWENNYEETDLAEIPINDMTYFRENAVSPDLQAAAV
jgi:hypothetical protein